MLWDSELATPTPGHSSLETMTQEDYGNDLVFRTNGEEYARIDGSKAWKQDPPPFVLEINAADNDEDVTQLVEHVAEKVDGVSVKMKPGGSIKMTGGASIKMSSGSINLG